MLHKEQGNSRLYNDKIKLENENEYQEIQLKKRNKWKFTSFLLLLILLGFVLFTFVSGTREVIQKPKTEKVVTNEKQHNLDSILDEVQKKDKKLYSLTIKSDEGYITGKLWTYVNGTIASSDMNIKKELFLETIVEWLYWNKYITTNTIPENSYKGTPHNLQDFILTLFNAKEDFKIELKPKGVVFHVTLDRLVGGEAIPLNLVYEGKSMYELFKAIKQDQELFKKANLW
jgi:hypothetical protein